MSGSDEFLQKLLATFRVEAEEHVNAISSGLVELEKAVGTDEHAAWVEKVYREAHSLKGAARAVALTDIEAVCQAMEGVLAAFKRGRVTSSPDLFDALHEAADTVRARLSAPSPGSAAPPDVVERLARLKGSEEPVEPPTAVTEPAPSGQAAATEVTPARDTVRVSTAKLDSLSRQAEELVSARLAAEQRTADLRAVRDLVGRMRRDLAGVQPDMRLARDIHEVSKILGFVEGTGADLRSLEAGLASLARALEQDARALGAMVDTLREDVKRALMLPFSTVFDVLPRMVRDLSRDRGKEVDLALVGGDVETDRRILEEIKDPLVHLLRNALDHGIEPPAERERLGKSRRGTVTVTAARLDGGTLEVRVADDGAGIDLGAVRAAAIKLGVVTAKGPDQIDDRTALSLVFRSGVSTSPVITDLSGRGLGLAIVQEKVERLSGLAWVEANPGGGTVFRIRLPLTLATSRGVLVKAADRVFVLPTTHVERVARVPIEDIRTVENRETVTLDGRQVSLVRLDEVLGLPACGAAQGRGDITLVVLGTSSERVAFVVDEVLDEQEVLVKGLGPQLPRVPNVAGATILGSGKVVPVLSVPDLMKSAGRVGQTAARAASPPAASPKSILVVEDSITARMLVKSILESAG